MGSFQKVLTALEACENTSSRNEKISLLKAAINEDEVATEILSEMCNLTMNPYILFRSTWKESDITPIPHLNDASFIDDAVWYSFSTYATLLANEGPAYINPGQEFSNRQVMAGALGHYPKLARKWLIRVLNKDLKNGVQSGTIEKIFPKLIPNFSLQLANALDWKELLAGKSLDNVSDWWMEKKFDGIRGVAIVENGKVKFISRNNRPIWNTELIEADIISKVGNQSLVIDGELYAGTWALSLSVTKTQSAHPEIGKLKFMVFDMMTLEEFTNRCCMDDQITRRTKLESVFSGTVNYVQCSTSYGLDGDMNEVMKKSLQFLNEGYEGSVLKYKFGKYEFDRSASWLKVKPSRFGKDIDVPIVGANEGNGRLAGSLGNIIVRYNGVDSGIGTGLSDEIRQKMWALHMKNELVGMLAEVAVQELTPDGALRFGVFMRLREDREKVEV